MTTAEDDPDREHESQAEVPVLPIGVVGEHHHDA
jgi:hypothetical protein